jgi:protein SCO1/2
MTRRTLLFGIAGLAVLVILTAVLYFTQTRSLTGTVLDPPWTAPEMDLIDQRGSPFSLTDQRGKVVLVYFGYVNCPDECPLTMAHLKLVRENLGRKADRMQVVMVSTDPARDTPEALGEFLGKFDPSFVGLTGTEEQLQKVWGDYYVTVEEGGEVHSSLIYVVDPAGDIRETIHSEAEISDIASDVEVLLQAQ